MAKKKRSPKKQPLTLILLLCLLVSGGFYAYSHSTSKPAPKSASNTVDKTPIKQNTPSVTKTAEKPVEKTSPPETKKEVKKHEYTGTADNKKLSWYFMPNKTHLLPKVDPVGEKLVNQYNAIYHGDVNSKTIYFTFDEGYETGYTPKILDSLKQQGVKATFFITGDYIKKHPDLVKRMVAEGHIVGNHTMTHPSLPTVSDEQFNNELNGVSSRFEALTGQRMTFLRPPMGEYSERTMRLASELGLRHVFWSVAFRDWEPAAGSPEENMQTVMGLIHPGALVLLHAENKANADMLVDLITSLRNEGYNFGSLDQL